MIVQNLFTEHVSVDYYFTGEGFSDGIATERETWKRTFSLIQVFIFHRHQNHVVFPPSHLHSVESGHHHRTSPPWGFRLLVFIC